jgi:phosphoribosylformimino-5-aminoimidazole carboxamide ribotide isomerase
VEIIPVIDLKHGIVVHARGGDRSGYAPVRSGLCKGSDPEAVVGGFLGLHPFRTIYVADLDSIEGEGHNGAAIERLGRVFPDVALWVDNGLADSAACRDWLALGHGDLVLGSESQGDLATLDGLLQGPHAARIILSLDFRGEAFLGPPALLERPERWPDRVIVMTLARVGSGQGPELSRLGEIRERAAGRRIFAAGGVGDAGDLDRLAALDVSGVLVASALHDGRVGRDAMAVVSG